MTEEIIIDGGRMAGITTLKNKIIRLEQENEELSKLIRGTIDYAEVCSVCKDEVTIYPNISGRTDYTQNEVECRTLAQIIARKNSLKQENEKLKEDYRKATEISIEKVNVSVEAEAYQKMKKALEEIKEINQKWLKRWQNDSDELMGFQEIETKINEVLE